MRYTLTALKSIYASLDFIILRGRYFTMPEYNEISNYNSTFTTPGRNMHIIRPETVTIQFSCIKYLILKV